MIIARACPGPRLLTQPVTSLRCLYSTANNAPRIQPGRFDTPPVVRGSKPNDGNRNNGPRHPPQHQRPQHQRPQQQKHERNGHKSPPPANPSAGKKKGEKTIVPQLARKFMTTDGKLLTTPDNWAFFQETGIEPDNGKTAKIYLGPENNRIMHNFSIRVTYSPLNILSPYHLPYFSPHDHPLADAIKSKYRLKLQQHPVWVYTNIMSDQPAIVRGVIARRLKAAFYTAMKDLGYPESGVRGTVGITIFDPAKAATNPAHLFGEALAKAVVKEWKNSKRKQPEVKKTKRLQW